MNIENYCNVANSKEMIAAGYVRLSEKDKQKIQDGEENSLSIINQKEYITNYCNEHDIKLYKIYADDGFSGSNFNRPAFKEMINDIECGIINCVIVKDFSRLGREYLETGYYIYKYFPEKNVRLISPLDSYDSYKYNESDDMIPFKTVMNHIYLKDTSRKYRNIRHGLMKQGLYVGSTIPYGYKRSEEDNRKFVIDDYAAKIVKRIFNMRKNGTTENMIARELTNEGILPPSVYNKRKGKTTFTTNIWKPCTISRILENEVYLGIMHQRKYECAGPKGTKKHLLPKDKWISIENAHEPIISKELFNEVNSLKKTKVNSTTRTKKYDYLLKGLVICADCGSPMLVRRTKKANNEIVPIFCCRNYARYRNGICSMHYYREDLLNEEVLNQIKKIFQTYANGEKFDNEYNNYLKESNTIFDNYQKDLNEKCLKLKKLDKALAELHMDKCQHIISEEEFISIKNTFSKEKETLGSDIVNIKLMINKSKEDLINNKLKTKIINNFLAAKNYDKNMLNQIISKITINKDKKVQIYFKFRIAGN